MLPSTVAGVIIAIKVIAFVGFVMFHQVQHAATPLMSLDDDDANGTAALLLHDLHHHVEKQEQAASPAAAFLSRHLPTMKKWSHESSPTHETLQDEQKPVHDDDQARKSYFRLPHYHFGSKAVKAGKALLDDFVHKVKKRGEGDAADELAEHEQPPEALSTREKMKAMMNELLPHAHHESASHDNEHANNVQIPLVSSTTHHAHDGPMQQGFEIEHESYKTAVRNLLRKAFVKVQSAAPTKIKLPDTPSFSSLLNFVPSSIRRRRTTPEPDDEEENEIDEERLRKYVSIAKTSTHIHHERPPVLPTAPHVPHHHAEHDSQLVLAFNQLWSAMKNMFLSPRSFECRMHTVQDALQSVLEAIQQRISRVRIEDAVYYMPDVLLIVFLTSLSHFIWDRITGGPNAAVNNNLLNQLQQQTSLQQFLSSSPTANTSQHQLRRNDDFSGETFVGPTNRPFGYAADNDNSSAFASTLFGPQLQSEPLRPQPVSASNVVLESQPTDAAAISAQMMNAQPPTRDLSSLISHEVLPTFQGENQFNRAARQSRSLTFSAAVNNSDRMNGRLFDSILESKRRYRVILKHFRQLQSHSQLLLEVLKNNAANNINNDSAGSKTNNLVDQSLIKEIEEEISTSNAELAVNENEEAENAVTESEQQNDANESRLPIVIERARFGPTLHPSSATHTAKDNFNFAHTSKSAPLPAGQRAEFIKQQLTIENEDDIDDSLAPARMAVSASCATQTEISNDDAEEIYRSLLAQAKNIDNVKHQHHLTHPQRQEQQNNNNHMTNENVADAGVLFSHNAALLPSDVVDGGNSTTNESWDKLLHSAPPPPPAAAVSDGDAISSRLRDNNSAPILSSAISIWSVSATDTGTATDEVDHHHRVPKQRTRRKIPTKSALAVLLAKRRRRQRRRVALRQSRDSFMRTKQKLLPVAFVMQTRLAATKIAVTRELTHAQNEVVSIRETLRRTQMECIGIVESELRYLKRKMEQLETRTLKAERKYTTMFHSLAKAMEIIDRRAPDELHLIKQLHPLDGVSGSNSQMDISNISSVDVTHTPSGSGAGSRVGLRQL